MTESCSPTTIDEGAAVWNVSENADPYHAGFWRHVDHAIGASSLADSPVRESKLQ
jgi:hypothetical protein